MKQWIVVFVLVILSTVVMAQTEERGLSFIVKFEKEFSQAEIEEQLYSLKYFSHPLVKFVSSDKLMGFTFVETEIQMIGCIHTIDDIRKMLEDLPGVQFVGNVRYSENGSFVAFTNEFLLETDGNVVAADLSKAIEQLTGTQAKFTITKNDIDPAYLKIIAADVFSTQALFRALEHIQTMDGVLFAEPNYIFQLSATTNDEFFPRQWALSNEGTTMQGSGTPGADMSVTEAWDITTGDQNIKIAILDSGVDTLHPDLAGKMLPGYDAVGDSTGGYPTPNYDSDGHGTACAGIAAAAGDNTIGTAGVAYDCSIIPIRIFYYVNLGTVQPITNSETLINAANWLRLESGADIASVSAGLPDDIIAVLFGGNTSLIDNALRQAHEQGRDGKGIPMFFSSGNENDPEPLWPARLDFTIAVTATSMCDERKSPSDCSTENWGGNYGPGTSFGAPGVRVSTADMLGSNGYTGNDVYHFFNGTSAACPNAAGVAALVLSVYPDATAADVQNIMEQTADKVGGYAYDSTYANGSWSQELGFGRVNAFAAVQLAQGIAAPITQVAKPYMGYKFLPNPSTGRVEIHNEIGEGRVHIYDIQGRLLYSQDVFAGIQTIMVPASIGSGTYIVSLEVDELKFSERLILIR